MTQDEARQEFSKAFRGLSLECRQNLRWHLQNETIPLTGRNAKHWWVIAGKP